MKKNILLLERKNKVLFVSDQNPSAAAPVLVATFMKNLESLGYTLSPVLADLLRQSSDAQITALYKEVTPVLTRMKGAHVTFHPMYPNFPAQVMEASDVELYVNAVLHYWFGMLPDYDVKKRPVLREKTTVQVIDMATEQEFENIFTFLVGANTSISEADREVVEQFFKFYQDDILRLLPQEVPSKEQVALVVTMLLHHTQLLTKSFEATKIVGGFVKTATDVLRVASALSNSDASLTKPPKFITFSRKVRRLMLELLDGMTNPVEDMARWKGYWLRLGEKLHPGEFAAHYPNIAKAFDQLRNEKVRTFNGKVELALLGDVNEAINLLITRPGDFARRLNAVLSSPQVNGMVVRDAFALAADRVAVPLLLQLLAYFDVRPTMGKRIVFPKGSVAAAQFLSAPNPMDATLVALIKSDIEAALVKRFALRESLGKVYIDPKLSNYLVPFSQRSASKTLRTVVRGSKMDMPKGDTTRFVLYWKENGSRCDIDLSASFFGDNFKSLGHVSWQQLRGEGCHHSGDITEAPEGACEFIDLHVPTLRKKGVRYMAMVLNSYTGQYYSQLSECFAGWMTRKSPGSGEIFDPRTVQQRIDLTVEAKVAMPAIFDLVERKVIWLDMADISDQRTATALTPSTAQLLEGFATMRKANLAELLRLHVQARGEEVQTPEEADVVFSETTGITPFDTEVIMSQYL